MKAIERFMQACVSARLTLRSSTLSPEWRTRTFTPRGTTKPSLGVRKHFESALATPRRPGSRRRPVHSQEGWSRPRSLCGGCASLLPHCACRTSARRLVLTRLTATHAMKRRFASRVSPNDHPPPRRNPRRRRGRLLVIDREQSIAPVDHGQTNPPASSSAHRLPLGSRRPSASAAT